MMHSILLPLALLGPPGGPGLAATPIQEATSPQAELDALVKSYKSKRDELYKAIDAAKDDDERARLWAGRSEGEMVPQFRALAEKYPQTDVAAGAWMWVMRLGPSPKDRRAAIDALMTDHIQSPLMVELPEMLVQNGLNPEVLEMLHALVAESPREQVRAEALMTLGNSLCRSGVEDKQKEGRECLQAVMAEYSAVKGRSSTYGAAAEGLLYELDRLQIGMTAPDFESVDENGVKWKLSDYRGKVVVVDFWGYW